MILFVDPGKRSIAWCRANQRQLVDCGYHTFEKHRELAIWLRGFGSLEGFEKVVCEMPQSTVKSERSMAIQNDVLDVAVTAGAVATIAPAALVHPSTWKGGSISKEKHHPRVLEALMRRPEGRMLLNQIDSHPKTIRHNVVDAVGIALWYLDRTATLGG